MMLSRKSRVQPAGNRAPGACPLALGRSVQAPQRKYGNNAAVSALSDTPGIAQHDAAKQQPKQSFAAALKQQQEGASNGTMSRRQLISTSMATMAMFGCQCCSDMGIAQAGEGWDYSNDFSGTGPATWPGMCYYGKRQSPRNLRVYEARPRPGATPKELLFDYRNGDNSFVSNAGHGTPQVNFAPGNIFQIGNNQYELLQFHFHTPSEHAIDGQRYAMEAHLVHKNVQTVCLGATLTGGLAVVGVMLESAPVGGEHPCLKLALENAPEPGGKVAMKQRIDPAMLLPPPNKSGHRPYVHYSGSLTTPPCSEEVEWYVCTEPLDIGEGQVLRFMRFAGNNKTYGQNSRPLQDEIVK